MTKKDLNWSEVIMNYLGRHCSYCGSTENLNIHHIIPLQLGGGNFLSNLEIVCRTHHYELHRQISKIFDGSGGGARHRSQGICEDCGDLCPILDNPGKTKVCYCHNCNKTFKVKKKHNPETDGTLKSNLEGFTVKE